MRLQARELRLKPNDRAVLETRCRATTTPQRDVRRARIVLLAAEGASTRSIARAVGVEPGVVSIWRHRFADHGLEGLKDRPRPGKKPSYTVETDKRILQVLDEPPPAGYARWTGRLIADRLGDVHEQHVWRVLREQKIDLAGRKSWCESNDPEFAGKAADVVGLYMAPPENAIVICVDEKPSIQALERAQGYLRLANGRTLTGHSHDYKRNGTSTLFAAFEVATGKVKAAHKKRRRRVEFLAFMNDIVAAYPAGTAIHVVLDNLNTHKPRLAGFRGYYLLDGGPDTLITVSMFDSADEALVSNEKAVDWVRNNVMEFARGMPEIMVGDVLVAEVK
jgi:transposase